MAKKSKSSARKRVRAQRATPPTGPVTLAQARTIARLKRPGRTVARVAIPPLATPASVGAEQKRLAMEYRHRDRDRIADYKATMQVMKQRGVKGLERSDSRRGKRASAIGEASKPLQVLAEGDSWFNYPVPFFGGSIIPRLEKRLGVPILNLAKAGDEVRYMLGVAQRKLLIEQMEKGCPAGGPWDLILFSGGGNDIVDNPMALWVRDYDASLSPAEHIHKVRFDAALALIRAGYEDLIELRDKLSPSTRLAFHAYDFAIPDGRKICNKGPWLHPTMELRRMPSLDFSFRVVKAMLQQFASLLKSIGADCKGVTFINGQGTLKPVEKSWHNELHPSNGGFNKFADLFHERIKTLFPNRVL